LKKLTVLHIIASDISGGAAKGAFYLHESLIEKGVDSILLKQMGGDIPKKNVYSISNSIYTKILRFIYTYLDRFPLFRYTKRERIAFSPFIYGFDITKNSFYGEADIIHLHWVNQGMISLSNLKKIKKPIVWTLRDMGVFTGGCHHSFACHKYENECGACPILKSNKKHDLSSNIQKRKIRLLPRNIQYVAISNWLKDCAERSRLLKDSKINVIYNGVDVNSFTLLSKIESRKELGLPNDKKIICLGAINPKDPYKGFRYAMESLSYLNKDFFFIFFGSLNSNEIPLSPNQFKNFGYISDTNYLNRIYSSSDVFLAPSIAEAFGKTLVEAMLSGTPVVCFDNGGPKDIVEHKKNGYKATPFDPKDLANGIIWCLIDQQRHLNLIGNATLAARLKFDIAEKAKEYIEVYKNILNN